MKLTIITDAGSTQVNGVTRTISSTKKSLEKLGWSVQIIEPENFIPIPYTIYHDIRVPITTINLKRMVSDFNPNYIHIATEFRLGLSARKFCVKNNLKFTTSYHTKFPEYAKKHFGLNEEFAYRYFRWFHSPSSSVMVSTNSMKILLEKNKFKNLSIWEKGVDSDQFKPYPRKNQYKKPIFLSVGRLSAEKNIEDFLDLPLPGTKLVVGSGPIEDQLKNKFPDAIFLGEKFGEDLAKIYSQADVFVFPSKSDTFGLVNLEAASCGVPVAAYPVAGPIDIVQNGKTGILDNDLQEACLSALDLERNDCIEFAKTRNWDHCTEKFIKNLISV